MGKRVNEKFLVLYEELESLCRERYGVQSGGVTEYINRLNNVRYAPDRDEVLPRLVNYRNMKYRLASDAVAVRRSDAVSKADVAWIRRFIKYMRKNKDPISVYVKRARRYLRMRRFRKIFTIVSTVFVILAVVAIIILFALNK